MAPRKVLTSEGDGIEDLKKTLEIMSGELSTIKNQQADILKLVKEVKDLKRGCDEKDKKFVALESRVMELEQNNWINDVVITGLEVRPRSYARAVEGVDCGQRDEEDNKSTEEQVVRALNDKTISLQSESIDNCFLLKKNNPNDRQVIILKLKDRKSKISLLQQGRKLKGTNIYLNEHLIKSNSDIAKRARELRKLGKIANTWTKDCKCFIKLNDPQGKVILIKGLDDLHKFN